jgi:hypothetical protein
VRYNSSGTFLQGAGTLISASTEYVYDMAVDSSGVIHAVGNFPARYAQISAANAISTVTAITNALGTTGATNVAVTGTGTAQMIAFGGDNAMGRIRVLKPTGTEDTSFGVLGTIASGIGSGLSSTITTNLAHGNSDIAFDASGRLLVGGQTFGLKRINTNGTLDSNFTTSIPSATTVKAISVHGSLPCRRCGKIVVGLLQVLGFNV